VNSQLTPLQALVLDRLAGLGWTLTGGAALAGYHLAWVLSSTPDVELDPGLREFRARLIERLCG
jgi:hypothetical protein